MDYTPTVSDREHRDLLAKASSNTASLATLVQGQATLNPSQRQAVENLLEAANTARELFIPPK